MNRGRLIAGVIWLVLAAAMIAGLISLLQRLMISGAAFIDELGGWLVEEEMAMDGIYTAEYEEMSLSTEVVTARPTETPEPEELIRIPIEQTPEELAEEMKNSSRGGGE